MKALSPAAASVLKRLHYPLEIMPVCVRRDGAYPPILRNLEKMMSGAPDQ
jgi:putative transposase